MVGREKGRGVEGNWQREMKFPCCDFSKTVNGMHARLSSWGPAGLQKMLRPSAGSVGSQQGPPSSSSLQGVWWWRGLPCKVGSGTPEKREPNLPRPHGTIHPFFHGICNTRWVVLINLVWKTDGDFFPEVNSSAFSKRSPCSSSRPCTWWQPSPHLDRLYTRWGPCARAARSGFRLGPQRTERGPCLETASPNAPSSPAISASMILAWSLGCWNRNCIRLRIERPDFLCQLWPHLVEGYWIHHITIMSRPSQSTKWEWQYLSCGFFCRTNEITYQKRTLEAQNVL